MQFATKTGHPAQLKSGCLILGIYANKKLSPAAKLVDAASQGHLTQILKHNDCQGHIGQTLTLYAVPKVASTRVMLVGLGREKDINLAKVIQISRHIANQLKKIGSKDALNCLAEAVPGLKPVDFIKPSVTTTLAEMYQFTECKAAKAHTIAKMTFLLSQKRQDAALKSAITQGMATANGVHVAKDLGNLPGNICTPSYLAKKAKDMAKGHRALKITILEEKDMKTHKMGAFLSVSQGSKQPGKLICMEYKGAPKTKKPVVLVGKAITFDSGGISLKPGPQMDEMKYDMCGGASVFGAMHAVAELKLPINVIGLVAAAENMPGGLASKPGDVVTTMSGQTVEILNTDAEGRLVLCDTLTYAEKFNPDSVIDIATLTGACVIALGKHPSGLFSNSDKLANDLLSAGERAHDRAWQLPIWDDYQPQLDSNFADMANIGGRDAGSITAACFLSRFAKKYRWAHLDIAGTAWHSGKNKGATGRPVPLLMEYLLNRAKK